MLNIPVPSDKLIIFQEELGLNEESVALIKPYSDIFVSRKNEFAAYFHSVFFNIPETRLILEYEVRHEIMVKIWAQWFERIFTSAFDKTFFNYLWNIGLRHVEVNLDQRFSNLGFSIIRQYCHKIILSEIPDENRTDIIQIVDRLLDFCLLVETSAYIEATTRCDIEIIKGIADRVRNPVTVIGGNIKRLQKKVNEDSPAYDVYESLIGENQRLEYMVADIKMYFDMFQEDTEFILVSLEEIIRSSIENLRANGFYIKNGIDLDIAVDASSVKADRRDMAYLFYHLIQNSIEAADPKAPKVRISSKLMKDPGNGVRIEIFNNGEPMKIGDIDRLYSPFFTTKPKGTGFGLPIIRLALRKNHGKILFHPVHGEGTKVIITLPDPEE